MRWSKFLFVGLSIFLAIFSVETATAQKSQAIKTIDIAGNQRIETSTIQSYLLINEGDSFDSRRINQSLKSLFSTGYFFDVSIKKKGSTLFVKVIENPVINRISFEGNSRIEDGTLKSEIQLKPRVVFNKTKVQRDVKRILDLYKSNGRFGASVIPKTIQLAQNRADLVFEIDEGPTSKIRRIRFIGNEYFDDGDLRSLLNSKEDSWWRILSNSAAYDSDKLKVDLELIRQHYLEEGYADFQVENSVAELTPDKKAFFITISVSEGKRYKFGDVNVSSGIKNVDGKELRSSLKMEKGDWFNNTLVEKSVNELKKQVGTKGYAFVEVKPNIDKNKRQQELNLIFEVREGPRVFVERIDITGNVRTVDSVIRREFRVVEGDAFDTSKLRRSKQAIMDLDYFSKVELKKAPGSSADKAIVTVDVEEKSTGSLNLGIGYGTDAGALFDVTLRERNLLGLGQNLALQTTIAGKKTALSLSFTEPYFRERDVAAGFDIFHTKKDLQSTQAHDSRSTGFGLRTSFPLSETFRQSWKYGLEYSEITNVPDTASGLIKAQKGSRLHSGVVHGLVYDTRDSKINPTTGVMSRLTNDLAGLGGDVFYLKNTLTGVRYFSPLEDFILSLSGRVGHVLGLGEDVEIPDRFFLGGGSLRGFTSAGVGPRDKASLDSLGGEILYNGSMQLTMPLGLPDDLGIKGRLFSDFGSLTEINPSNANVFDEASIRASLGAGLGWTSPFGPINLDFGFPILKESLDKKEVFRINFGTRF